MSENDENREYEQGDPLQGAVDRRDGTDDAYAEVSDELSEAIGLADDDPVSNDT
ncbi:hypothetical protein [Rhabdothermincola salaria]|uniref:hypothetical protein n=1 Tax=Rhabdothermincola salaria TaxID=2903142 RepID=UPI001E2E4251|nr:hypothetical protein [Rhabdothermincola salaria]MCD9622924.1 hypothetical protein [Rhabdothermincola salaria]